MNNLKLDKAGQDIIKQFEGFSLVGYLPTPNDIPTVGYGSVRIFGRKVILGEKITEDQAQAQFDLDTAWAVNAVNHYVSVPLNQNQFDALVSFVYNEGETAFRKSTLLSLINSGDFIKASSQFDKWIYQGPNILKGLVTRRKLEKELFLKEV